MIFRCQREAHGSDSALFMVEPCDCACAGPHMFGDGPEADGFGCRVSGQGLAGSISWLGAEGKRGIRSRDGGGYVDRILTVMVEGRGLGRLAACKACARMEDAGRGTGTDISVIVSRLPSAASWLVGLC